MIKLCSDLLFPRVSLIPLIDQLEDFGRFWWNSTSLWFSGWSCSFDDWRSPMDSTQFLLAISRILERRSLTSIGSSCAGTTSVSRLKMLEITSGDNPCKLSSTSLFYWPLFGSLTKIELHQKGKQFELPFDVAQNNNTMIDTILSKSSSEREYSHWELKYVK